MATTDAKRRIPAPVELGPHRPGEPADEPNRDSADNRRPAQQETDRPS